MPTLNDPALYGPSFTIPLLLQHPVCCTSVVDYITIAHTWQTPTRICARSTPMSHRHAAPGPWTPHMGPKKRIAPNALDSGRLDHGLPLLDSPPSGKPMFVRVFRDLLFQICMSADSYPSACQPVSKLDVRLQTYIYLGMSPFLLPWMDHSAQHQQLHSPATSAIVVVDTSFCLFVAFYMSRQDIGLAGQA